MIDGTFATGPLVRVLLIVWTGASRQLLRSSSVATVDIIIVAGQVQLQTVHVPVQDPTQHTHTGVIVQRDARMGHDDEDCGPLVIPVDQDFELKVSLMFSSLLLYHDMILFQFRLPIVL